MPLKNYTTTVTVNKSINLIQKHLSTHGARQVMFNYSDTGEIVEVAFVIATAKGNIPVRLPAQVKKVEKVLYDQNIRLKDDDQYLRVAWRNIEMWVDAQMALLETDMVKMEQIFLPYMVVNQNGQTMFDKLQNEGFLLESGK